MNPNRLKHLPEAQQQPPRASRGLPGIVGNTGWLFADKAFRMAVGLTLGIWIARYLGPDDFGLLSYSIAFVSLFTAIATLGLDSVVVRELAVRPETRAVVLGSTVVLKLAGGLLAYAVVVSAISLILSTDRQTILLVAIIAGGLIFQATDALDYWFQSQVQARYVVLARGSAFIAISSAKVWLLLNHASLEAFAWAGTIEVALASGALIVAFKATGNAPSTLSFHWPVARRLLQESWPLAISGVLVLLTMQLDKIILGEVAGNAAVGIYSVAGQFSMVWYMVPMIIGSSIAPSIVKSYAARDARYLSDLRKIYAAMTYVSVGTAIAVFFLAEPLIELLFGVEYRAAGRVLAVHIWGSIFVFHVSIRTRALVAEGKQRYVTAIAALTLLSSIPLNIFLIERAGPLGAAYASLISWALCATIFPAIWPETRKSAVMFLKSYKF